MNLEQLTQYFFWTEQEKDSLYQVRWSAIEFSKLEVSYLINNEAFESAFSSSKSEVSIIHTITAQGRLLNRHIGSLRLTTLAKYALTHLFKNTSKYNMNKYFVGRPTGEYLYFKTISIIDPNEHLKMQAYVDLYRWVRELNLREDLIKKLVYME